MALPRWPNRNEKGAGRERKGNSGIPTQIEAGMKRTLNNSSSNIFSITFGVLEPSPPVPLHDVNASVFSQFGPERVGVEGNSHGRSLGGNGR